MDGLPVVGSVVLGSVTTQKAITGVIHGKEIVKRQNQYKCQEVLSESRKNAGDVLDSLRWVTSKYGHAALADFYDLARARALYEDCKFGWTPLWGTRIVCTRNGYTIELLRTTPPR